VRSRIRRVSTSAWLESPSVPSRSVAHREIPPAETDSVAGHIGFELRCAERKFISFEHSAMFGFAGPMETVLSPHFAFTDSIYPEKDRELQSLYVSSIVSTMTYAGMHTAASRAFKLI
jgi:hypothetical protein